jgi:hypothetical protein
MGGRKRNTGEKRETEKKKKPPPTVNELKG